MNKKYLLGAAIGIIFLVTSCGNNQGEESSAVNDLSNNVTENDGMEENNSNEDQQASQEIDLESANLEGYVLQVDDQQFTVNATTIEAMEDGGEAASVQVDEEGESTVTVSYNEETIFEVVEIDRGTYQQVVEVVDKESVKRDSTVMIWGTYEGNNLQATEVAIIRFIGDY